MRGLLDWAFAIALTVTALHVVHWVGNGNGNTQGFRMTTTAAGTTIAHNTRSIRAQFRSSSLESSRERARSETAGVDPVIASLSAQAQVDYAEL